MEKNAPGKNPEEIFNQEEIYKVLFELSPSGILLEDDRGNVIDANKVYCDTFGYTREELIGKNVRMFTSPGTFADVESNIKKMLMGETLIHVENSVKKDGSTCYIKLHEKKITLPDGKTGILCLTEDITHRLNLESRLSHAQKMESIGTLAGGIAHDFNNLLMGILGNTSLMQAESEEGSRQDRQLRSIEEYVNRGTHLTKQLLGFAMKGKYILEPLDLNIILEHSAGMFGRTKKEINIQLELGSDIWGVEGDRGQIEQVMMNLFINAWQAMESGGDIIIRTENVILDIGFTGPYGLKPGKYVKISVSDTGTGMTGETMTKIFDPFFTTRQDGKGTGLGLASAYGIVKNHSGIISVESEPDIGSTFTIFFPFTEKKVKMTKESRVGISSGHETILLADDEEASLTATAEMLKHLGYQVITARNGVETVRSFQLSPDKIDLVVLDMIMPGYSGRKTFDELKKIDPDVRILLSSGYSLDGQASDIMKMGCSGFIQKPFNMNQLSAKLREILDKNQ